MNQEVAIPPALLALMAEIGPRWASGPAATGATRVSGNVALMVEQFSAVLAHAPQEDLRIERDIAYGPHARQRLDVYAPQPDAMAQARAAAGADSTPVLIFVHGGAFTDGEKDRTEQIYSNVPRWFARQGVLAINMEYRNAPDSPYPAGSEDVGLVVAWARAQAARWGADPQRVFIMGQSAGGAHTGSYAYDRRLQEGTYESQVTAPVMRYLGVGDIVVRNDLQTDRYNLVRPRQVWRDFAAPQSGLGTPSTFGSKIPGAAVYPQVDEQALAFPANEGDPPPVAVVPVTRPGSLVRAQSTEGTVLLAGDGDGLIDATASGLVDGSQVVRYSASMTPAQIRAAVRAGATIVVTDTNRKRGRRWSTVRDTMGYTEAAGEAPLVKDESDARLLVFPDSTDAAATVSQPRGVALSTVFVLGSVGWTTDASNLPLMFDFYYQLLALPPVATGLGTTGTPSAAGTAGNCQGYRAKHGCDGRH
jgi:acetyl esterase/lipase